MKHTAALAECPIRVGLMERHGMVDEVSRNPPLGVMYSFTNAPQSRLMKVLRSPIKGYLRQYNSPDHDLLESVMYPVLTDNRWILSLADFQECTAFELPGIPLPRALRVAFIKNLLLKDNLKKICFWSNAGRRTLQTYGHVTDPRVLEKVTVVYPAIRQVPDELIRFHDEEDIHILFSGDFFRKGGANMIDAFEMAQKRFPSIKLRLCCDERISFNTRDHQLREKYLVRIKNNPAITLGRVDRQTLIHEILPHTDIYALPTYIEGFGFALLEAMAFGIPVISTTYFAIPEVVEDGVSGFLIDTDRFDCERLFRGYVVNKIPADFHEYMSEQMFLHLCALIESTDLRRRMGEAGVAIARSKFSFETRNQRMLDIYREAMAT
jgi:glycosyltransferase involved in cell wall biosynthesis